VKHELLDRFQAKAGCMHTQAEADRIWPRLKPFLSKCQESALITAWGHHRDCRLGRRELDVVCADIRREWGE
jgi:hypothetical protein